MQKSTKTKVFLYTGIVIIVLCSVFAACFGLIFTKILNNTLVIDEGTAVFDQFTSPSTPIYMNFYFFNVSNPDEIKNYGAKPILQEVGPYVYTERFDKFDFLFDDSEGTVSYYQNTTYFFNAERSNGSESDLVTTLNAVMVLVGALGYDNLIVKELLWPEIEAGMDLFETFTVGELLFYGWEMPTYNFDLSYIPLPIFNNTEGLSGSLYEILLQLDIDVPFLAPNRVGIFYGSNMTDDGLYKVNTGAKGMDKYLYIQEWKNETHLNYWDDYYCDMINGTDGTQFPPGVDRNDIMRLYTSDLCRSLYLEYADDVIVQDAVKTYHFYAPEEMLMAPPANPLNWCYCALLPGDVDCLGNSMLNLAPCRGVPIVLSTPHFYQGDKAELAKFDGLNPQKELHETFLDIEPTSGVVMSASKRIQLNLPLRKYGNLPSFQNIPECIFPILWADENALISKEDADKFNKVLTLPFIIVYSICGVLILVGLILIVIGVVRYRKEKKEPKFVAIKK